MTRPSGGDRRRATAALGAALHTADPSVATNAVLVSLIEGKPVERDAIRAALGARLVDDLVRGGVLRTAGDGFVSLRVLALAHGVIFVAPDPDPDDPAQPEAVYLDQDSALLTEAALRLAPSGRRAVDLGTGTGLHAALLARHYDTVVATDLGPRVAAAARLTLELNGHDNAGVVVADVAAGLRPASFDLVTANPPWVPSPPASGAAPRLYADGGPTGTEVPCRFIREGAALLRPGGIAITLALDIECDDGRRPVRETCAELAAVGYVAEVVPTLLSRLVPELESNLRRRRPRVVAAEHVAVVVAALELGDDRARDLRRVIGALGQRWVEADAARVAGLPTATGTSTKSRTRSR